ncbi:MAG TPA: hypothetical protein VGO67_09310 [Verrucomicrobiae bacterium]
MTQKRAYPLLRQGSAVVGLMARAGFLVLGEWNRAINLIRLSWGQTV